MGRLPFSYSFLPPDNTSDWTQEMWSEPPPHRFCRCAAAPASKPSQWLTPLDALTQHLVAALVARQAHTTGNPELEPGPGEHVAVGHGELG
jgi:hypothetical protein